MASFNTIQALQAHLKEEIAKVMDKDVKSVIQTYERTNLDEVVYSPYVYTPVYYTRRKGSGGLLDRENMVGKAEINSNSVTLAIENITKRNPHYDDPELSQYPLLTPLIVYGNGGAGGHYHHVGEYFPYAYEAPRDFITATREELREKRIPYKFLAYGLQDKGMTVDYNWR